MDTVRLRPTVEADRDVLFAQQNDPVANAMAAFPPRDEAAFAEHLRSILADPSAFAYTAEVRGETVGWVLSWTQDDHREVGYWIGRPYWGRGYATAALTAFLAIERTRPLRAFIQRANVASRRVAERCGFEHVRDDQGGDVPFAVYELDG